MVVGPFTPRPSYHGNRGRIQSQEDIVNFFIVARDGVRGGGRWEIISYTWLIGCDSPESVRMLLRGCS